MVFGGFWWFLVVFGSRSLMDTVCNSYTNIACVAGGAWRMAHGAPIFFLTRLLLARPFPPDRLGIPLLRRIVSDKNEPYTSRRAIKIAFHSYAACVNRLSSGVNTLILRVTYTFFWVGLSMRNLRHKSTYIHISHTSFREA